MLNQNIRTEFTNRSQQVALLPSVNTVFTQGPGYCKDGTKFNYKDWTYYEQYAYTHQKYRAMDLHTEQAKLLAPFDCTCVYFEYGGSSAKNAIFQSNQPVVCADGTTSYVTFMVTHGGPNVQTSQGTLKLNDTFRQGEWLYTEGTEGPVAKHIHLNVIKRGFTSFSVDTEFVRQQGYVYNNEGKLEAYDFLVLAFKNDANLEDIFYLQDGETVSFDSASTMWESHVSFKTYSGSGEWNGWIADGGNWYYYVEGVKKTGWLEDPENSAKWFYLDPTKGGAMSTGWIEVSGVDYYMNPANGQSGHDANLPGGQMTRSKWVAGGSKWYYIKESGAMAKSESVTVNGKKYNFDSNGVCLNP